MTHPPAGGLLVIGDVVTDVVARHARPVARGTDTEADIVVRPGGSGANTAAWAAYCGADVRLLARAGLDTAEWHRARLADGGVRPHLRIDPERPNAVIIILVDDAGERTMLTNRGAGGHLGPEDWNDDLLDGVEHVHISGYALFAAAGRDLVRIVLARAAGRSVSVDPASVGFLADLGADAFIEATAGLDLVVPNRDEAACLTGEEDPAAAAVALSRTYGLAVVKLGSDGALAARAGEVVARASVPPVRAVDSTGAGDAFAGGLLTARLEGAGHAAALEAGCRAGALAVARVGGRPPLRR